MGHRELHIMSAVLLEDRQTMRYTCTQCQRCLEDGPEGLTLVFRGDPGATHQAGSIPPAIQEVEPLEPNPPPTLH